MALIFEEDNVYIVKKGKRRYETEKENVVKI